jgi:predicted lipoprotein with Yx(FWY)xxD motif
MRGPRFVIVPALLAALLCIASLHLNASGAAADTPSAAVAVDQPYPYTYPYYNYGYAYPYYNTGYTYPYYNTGYTYPYYNTGYTYPYNNTGYTYPYYSTGNTYPYNTTGYTSAYGSYYNNGYTYPYYNSYYNAAYAQPVTTTYSMPRIIISSATLTQPAPLPTSGSYTQPAYASSGAYGVPISMLTVATSAALGPHLADARGMTLYTLSADTPGKSVCIDTCTSIWPPATPSGTLSAQAGLTGTFSPMTRADGSMQATYSGMPLYFYSQDVVAGDTKGNGISDQWGTWSVGRP